VARTWHTLLCDILLILWTFPIPCQGFTILLNLFRVSLCFLLATNQPHFPFFILYFFTIKSHVYRAENHHVITPHNRSDLVSENLSKLRILLTRLHILLHFVAFRLFHCLLRHAVSCPIARHHSSLLLIASRCVKSDFSRNPLYIYSLFSHLSLRLLKKGLTSPRSFHSFCRFIPLQVYHCGSNTQLIQAYS
jgi:hypothetical protein